MKQPKTLDYSLFDRWRNDEITIHEAAREFCSHGWTNFVDEEYTRQQFQRILFERLSL